MKLSTLLVRAMLALALQLGIAAAIYAADVKLPDVPDVPTSTWISAGYAISVLAGVVIHYFNDKFKGKIGSETIWQYFFSDAPGASMAMVIVILTSVGGVIASGILAPMTGWAVFLLGLQNGYTTDSLVNSGAPPVAPPAKP